MPITRREFVEAAAKGFGRPLPDNLLNGFEGCLCRLGLTFSEIESAQPVAKQRGVLELRIRDIETSSGTRFRVVRISKSFEVLQDTTGFEVAHDHTWRRQPTEMQGDT